MVNVELVKETTDNGVIIELISPVVNGAWQPAGGSGEFHEELAKQYPHLTFMYCLDGKWTIRYIPSNDSMIEIAELISRICREEIMYYLGKIQYLSNHPIPNLTADAPSSENAH